MNSYNKTNVKFLSVVSYIWPLFVIGKFSFEKNCEQVKFHVKQGEILFYLMLSLTLSSIISEVLLNYVSESLSIICFLINIGIGFSWIILAIMGIASAISNSKLSLPIVGFFANKLNKEG